MPSESQAESEFADLRELSPADFEPLLNSEFSVDLRYLGISVDGSPVRRDDAYPDEKLAMELVEVKRREPSSPDTRQEPFDLLFRGRHDLPLYGDSHLLSHPSLGKLVLLLTPVHVSPGNTAETHPEGRFYECVVN